MSQSNKRYSIIAGIIILILIILFIFIQELFRNDTEKYQSIKRENWSRIQQAGNDGGKITGILKETKSELDDVKCTKVDTVYRQECDSLKSKVDQLLALSEIQDPTASQTSQASSLSMEIANILKK